MVARQFRVLEAVSSSLATSTSKKGIRFLRIPFCYTEVLKRPEQELRLFCTMRLHHNNMSENCF